MSPIVRDDDIITNVGNAAAEPARIVETGQLAQNITFIDASADDAAGAPGDVATAVANAGNDSIVVFEHTAGPVTIGQAGTGSTVAMQSGQFVGGQFDVQGVNSGAVGDLRLEDDDSGRRWRQRRVHDRQQLHSHRAEHHRR